MRIYLPSMEHAKRVSKRLQKELSDKPLSLCQLAVARCVGYKDWHELEALTGRQPPSLPDWLVPFDICQARRDFQSERIISTPGIGIDMMLLPWMRDVVEKVQPSDFARENSEHTLEEEVFPSAWDSDWIDDKDRGPNGEIYLARLLSAFNVIRTTGIVSQAKVGRPEAVLGKDFGGAFEKNRGDGFRCLAMRDDSNTDVATFDLVVLFTAQLVVRGGFIDQIYICIGTTRGHDGISQGHLQHAACHIYDYLNCDRMHPAFDAELTSNPRGLLVGVSCEEKSAIAQDLAAYVREVFEARREENSDGGFLVDAFLRSSGSNEFPVRRVFDDTPQYSYAASDEDDNSDEERNDIELSPEMETFAELMFDQSRLLAAYGKNMPQLLAVYLRGRGHFAQADRILGEMEGSFDKPLAFATIVNGLRKEKALTDAESAFLID